MDVPMDVLILHRACVLARSLTLPCIKLRRLACPSQNVLTHVGTLISFRVPYRKSQRSVRNFFMPLSLRVTTSSVNQRPISFVDSYKIVSDSAILEKYVERDASITLVRSAA